MLEKLREKSVHPHLSIEPRIRRKNEKKRRRKKTAGRIPGSQREIERGKEKIKHRKGGQT